MNQIEFEALHGNCVEALRSYVDHAETTSEMLAKCTPEPLPLKDRLALLAQELVERDAHTSYLGFKRQLHDAAVLGYGNPG